MKIFYKILSIGFLCYSIQAAAISLSSQDESLFTSIKKGSFEQVQESIKNGANINASGQRGITPLIWAIMEAYKPNKPYLKIIRYLVEHGADVNKGAPDGLTPLKMSAQLDYTLAKYLVNHGANLAKEEGGDALVEAAELGNLPLVKYFLGKGVSVNTTGNHGSRTLQGALLFSVNLCMDLRKDEIKRMSSHIHKSACDSRTAQYLIDHGADINSEDEMGTTPLIAASSSNNLPIVKELIRLGVDVNFIKITPFDSSTALIQAAGMGNLAVVKYLVAHGARINSKGLFGASALSVSVAHHHKTAEFLKEHGAVL